MEAATFYSKKKPPPPPPSSFNKTAAGADVTGGGYFPSSYDDVFGGPPKFAASTTLAPRAEDYSEIFSGFRTSSSSRASSSIPVLDLPAVDGVNFDSIFDYDDVFGGLNAVDFAVPFDELFRSSDGFDASDGDDAWTPVGTESLSDDSDPFAFSEKSQCFLNANINQPSEDKQYNVSYHKVHPGTSTCIPDTIHVTQLNDVPGYTCVVEEANCFREMGKERSCTQAAEDIVLNMEAPPIITHKHVKKTLSHLSHEGASSKSSGPKASENCGFEAKDDGSLPPFFDMEVDASSSAAVSAAAMKDVMEKAQAKLKAAREFRGRKDTVQNNGEGDPETDVHGGECVEMAHIECVSKEKKLPAKSSSKARHGRNISQNDGEVGLETDVNGGDSVEMAHMECVSKEKKLHATSDRGACKTKSSSKARHGRNISQILPDTLDDVQAFGVNGQPARTKCNLPMDTALTDIAGEWKEAKQYFEFVNNDNSRLAYQPPSNGDGKNKTSKQEDDNDNDSDSAEESCVTQTNRRKLKATKAVSRQGYYEKMIKVAQEVHDTVTSGHAETKEGLQDIFHGDRKEQKPELIVEPEKHEGRVWDTHQAEAKYAEVIGKAEAEMKPKNVLGDETMETRETDCSYRDLNGRNRNDLLVNMTKEFGCNMEGERRVKGTREREASGRGAQEGIAELSTEALKQGKNKESREVKDKKSNVAFEEVFGGERLQTTFESKEKDSIEGVQRMKAECWTPKEALEGRVAKERLERTCEGQENYHKTKLREIYEHEEHIEKEINGRGPEMMIDENVELEKCWEYLETLEQEKIRLNLDKDHNLVDEINSVQSQKKEEKLEQTAEKGNVESKFKLRGELGESVNLHEKTDFKEDKNGALKSHMEAEEDDEDQEPDSSSYIELSMKKHQKLSNAVNLNGNDVELDAVPCMLKRRHTKANGFLEVSSGKGNGEIDTILLDDSKLKGFRTSDVQFDAKELRAAAPQVGLSDKELEGKDDHASPKMPQMKANGSMELSAEEENDDIDTVLPEETRSKAGETTDVIDDRQTVFPEAHEGLSDDEHERRRVPAPHTLQMNENNTKLGEGVDRCDQIMINENRKVEKSVSDFKLVKASHLERGGMTKHQGGKEENTRPAHSERMNGWNEHSSKRVGAHSVMPDRKQCIQRTFQVSSLGQNIERTGKMIDNDGSLEEMDEEKKRYLEKEHLRKLEEEREREIEREKDKMAVEIAVREARERAYADARDRAERAALERATEEVRQRAMAEARERLEKACAEARERSLTNKASEARLRAERAAVERATAEVRQRAIEKSMADRATFETRERVQRSVSEKFTSERDVIMRQSSFPLTSERFETGNGEPAERCKARLERHRRTVERVANALSEKNMRDLLAQREQAERNRFAETLDADIKRWSNGKAGNLRALLSTLQYILGPDSGWQSIPLTEVITAAAVKKAYRKATLCVHPDKLQQRGASIQQKYISEKVFDLLKDAWNRFNSEEK